MILFCSTISNKGQLIKLNRFVNDISEIRLLIKDTIVSYKLSV